MLIDYTTHKKIIDLVSPEIKERLWPRLIPTLEETNIPRHAFVGLQITKRRHWRPDKSQSRMENELIGFLTFVNVEDQPSQKYIIEDLLQNKAGKVICYGNFPSYNDPDPKRAKKYMMYSEAGAGNPWDNLASYLDSHLDREKGQSQEIQTAKAGLLTEIEKLKAENEALKASKESIELAKDTVLPKRGQAKEVANEKK